MPSIKELREKLGYGDFKQNRCQTFYDDTRAFRKKFISSEGIEGKDLHEWKNPTHQAGLSELATAYLETPGFGPLFWPENPASKNYNGIEHRRDSSMIKDLLVQLFYCLNLQQYRNQKYHGNRNTSAISGNTYGTSNENPIHLDSTQSTATEASTSAPKVPAFATGKFRFRSVTADSEPAENTTRGQHAASQRDPYSISSSPIAAQSESPSKGKRNQRFRCPPSSKDDSDYHPPAKRSKYQAATIVTETNSRASFHNKPGSLMVKFHPRKSQRGRRAQRRPSQATEDMIEEAIASPICASTCSELSEIDVEEPPLSRSCTAGVATTPPDNAAPFQAAALAENTTDEDSHRYVTAAETGFRARSDVNNIHTAGLPPEEPCASRPATPLPSRPRIVVAYHVIRSRSPYLDSMNWKPEGRFRDMTLSQIKEAIPLQLDADPSARGLLFTLGTPAAEVKFAIAHGEDEQLIPMRERFDRVIKSQIPQGPWPQTLSFAIDIEVLRDENQGTNEAPIWEGDVDW